MSSFWKNMFTRANQFTNNNRPYIIPVFRTSRTTTAVRNNLRNRYGKRNKRVYRHFKSRFYNLGYKWLMKFANNTFNFKFDYMGTILLRSGYNKKVVIKVSEAQAQDELNLLDVFYGNNENVESQWSNLAKLYKYYKVSAVKVRFKAYQTVDSQIFRPGMSINDQTAGNMPAYFNKHIPNLLVQLMTQREHSSFEVPANIKDVQRQVDRPYSRIISVESLTEPIN